MIWYLYLLRCSDSSLYCGITNNLEKRVHEHNLGLSKGAKYTKAKRPVVLVYSEKFLNKNEALQREFEIKKLSKEKKELLIQITL